MIVPAYTYTATASVICHVGAKLVLVDVQKDSLEMRRMLLVVANAGHCLRLPYNIMILAGGHYKQTQSNYVIAAIINIVISVLAVRKWGLVGVAVGTVIAMFYQTIWMAVYDSKNLIKWPLRNFVKQILVDIISIVILHFVTRFLVMDGISYFAWILLAIKVSIVGCLVILIVNSIFYREHVQRLMGKFIHLLKKQL